jgi:hypothetical protein
MIEATFPFSSLFLGTVNITFQFYCRTFDYNDEINKSVTLDILRSAYYYILTYQHLV